MTVTLQLMLRLSSPKEAKAQKAINHLSAMTDIKEAAQITKRTHFAFYLEELPSAEEKQGTVAT